MTALALIACCARKLAEAAPARSLYQGQLFKGSVALAEARGWRWAVLSAKHGLVMPEEVIEPYEQRLARDVRTQRRWATQVMTHLDTATRQPSKVIFLAGADYRRFLVGHLKGRGVECEIPMQELGIGRQLQWLKNAGAAEPTGI